ncbi:MAG: hypothetical protein HPY62_01795 [Bacteroidales bacterium]|nr:hypothetical protein [Bacteroidales bacterium]
MNEQKNKSAGLSHILAHSLTLAFNSAIWNFVTSFLVSLSLPPYGTSSLRSLSRSHSCIVVPPGIPACLLTQSVRQACLPADAVSQAGNQGHDLSGLT